MSEITFKDQAKVLQYVTEAISLFNPGSTALNAANYSKFARILYVLSDLISVKGFLQNDDRKRFLIHLALGSYSSHDTKSIETLTNSLVAEAGRGRDQPEGEFFVVFPLNISYTSSKSKRHFTVGRMRLNLRSFAYVKAKFDFKQPYEMLREKERGIEGNIYNFTYIIVSIKGAKDPTEAFWMAHQRVSLFRSLCNLVLRFGVETIMVGHPCCLGEVNPPKYMFVFNQQRKFVVHWFSSGEFKYKLLELEPTALKAINKTVKDFEQLKHGNLKNILTNCLTVYGYALDETEPGYIFLNMWQIMELIALKDQSGITEDKVKNRIRAIFRSSQIVSDVLEILFNKRNRLVHEGQLANFSLEDVNQVKMLAEGSMRFLFSNINRLKSVKALEDFYGNVEKSKEEIDKKMSVLKYIKKLKMT